MNRFGDKFGGLTGNAKAAYDSLEFYSQHVMGYGNPEYQANSKFLKRVYQELQYSDENLLILGPRGSAKSTAASVTYTTWELGRNPLLRFILAFASMEGQGTAFCRQIKHVIENNVRYQEIFGTLKPKVPEKWSDTEFILERPTPPGGLKDASVSVTGVGSSVPSKRADRVLCDDLVTQANAYSDTQRKSVISFVFQTLYPVLVPGTGRLIIIGSRWDPRDLYAHTARQWGLEIPKTPDINFQELFLGR